MPIKTLGNIPEDKIFLFLEDMENIRKSFVKDLRELGLKAQIIEADCVKAAILACNKNPIQFIIADWNLPDGTGFDFLKKIKVLKKYKNTPFLMCTTMDEIDNIMDAINEGANEYIVKPWEKEELNKKIIFTWNQVVG